jgi:hypothetical protein
VCPGLLPAAVTGLWLQLQKWPQLGSAQCASHPRQRTTDDSCKWLRLGYKRLLVVMFRHGLRTKARLHRLTRESTMKSLSPNTQLSPKLQYLKASIKIKYLGGNRATAASFSFEAEPGVAGVLRSPTPGMFGWVVRESLGARC